METNYYAFLHSGEMVPLGKHISKIKAEEEAVRSFKDPDSKWDSCYAFISNKEDILSWAVTIRIEAEDE